MKTTTTTNEAELLVRIEAYIRRHEMRYGTMRAEEHERMTKRLMARWGR